MTDKLSMIKDRFSGHYNRGLAEPVGLPRSAWRDDTEWLIQQVIRLQSESDELRLVKTIAESLGWQVGDESLISWLRTSSLP